MSRILRLSLNFLKNEVNSNCTRAISLNSKLHLKEIHENRTGNELLIQGVYKTSPRAEYLVQVEPEKCPMCSTGLDVKHTDVLILSQFMRSDGCMLPRRVTGLCKKQQKRMSALVTMAQKSGLMPNLNPEWSHKDPKKRYGFKKYNKYFDESTIKLK